MTPLQESLRHRRSVEEPSESGCASTEASRPALLILTGGGELWALPWSHFVSARHAGDGSHEQLTLLFASYQVEMHGARLISLMPEIAGFRLESLRGLPAKYEPMGNASAPFIERLTVRQIGTEPSTKSTALC